MRVKKYVFEMVNESATERFAILCATYCVFPLMIELVGDVGAGKTTFTRFFGRTLGISEPIQSPTFTINRTYELGKNRQLVHYDFYRLHDAGILHDELREVAADADSIVIIEWASSVAAALPKSRVIIEISPTSELSRHFEVTANGDREIAMFDAIAGSLEEDRHVSTT